MRALPGLLLAVGTLGVADAGELVLANGSRFAGELANEVLVVSTGTGLIEVNPDEVQSLSRDEIRLRDGRVVRGTLVGGSIRARTAFGEVSVRTDELAVYRAAPPSGTGSMSPPVGAPGTAPTAVDVSGTPAGGAAPGPGGSPQGLPALASYQWAPAQAPAADGVRLGGRWLEVTQGETPVYREALVTGAQVGRARRGERVVYVDAIDRRLHILNWLVFDGGHWIKVRLADGREGWVPAQSVRELP